MLPTTPYVYYILKLLIFVFGVGIIKWILASNYFQEGVINVTKNLETIVRFSDYNNSQMSCVTFNLMENIDLVAKATSVNGVNGVQISMRDIISQNDEVSGFVEQERLKSLIKILSTLYKQSASNSKEESDQAAIICGR